MAEINLAPSGASKSSLAVKRFNLFSLIFSGILISLTFAGFTFFLLKKNYAKNALEDLLQQEQKIKIEVMDLDPNSAKEFQNKVRELNSLLEQHVYWSAIFPIIEKATISTVWYDSLSASLADKSVLLQGKAQNLDGAARQIVSFKDNKNFQDVYLKEIGADSDGKIRLSLELKFSDNLIKINKKSEEIDLK